MTLFSKLFAPSGAEAGALYRAIVARAREPGWYREGGVPDTPTGRFDLIAALSALVFLRLEREGEPARASAARLTEAFVDDMKANLREMGTSEPALGKAAGRLVGALGGRIAAFREAGDDERFEAAVRRNLFHESPASAEAISFVLRRLRAFDRALPASPLADMLEGQLP